MTKQINVATLKTDSGTIARPIAPERFATFGYVDRKMTAMATDIRTIEEGFASLCDKKFRLSRTERRLLIEALARRISVFEHEFRMMSETLE
jgi:hypothetical protein